MFLLITLPVFLLAIVSLLSLAFADVALSERRGSVERRLAKFTSTKPARPVAGAPKTPIFVPGPMHSCESVRVVWY
jgi:hypothetical protein